MNSSIDPREPAAFRRHIHAVAFHVNRANRRTSLTGSAFLATLLFGAVAAQADPVTDWNKIMEDTVLAANPFVQTRSAAITQLAVFDAVNAIIGDHAPYLGQPPPPSGASPEAAAVAAAHRALVMLHPERASVLDALRAGSLAAIADGPAKENGIAVGVTAADALLLSRANDGSNVVMPYTPGTQPGQWQPTPPAYAAAFGTGWGRVVPFGILSGAQFRPPPPPLIYTGKFARDYREVKDVGAVNSVERPPDRTDVARFYAVVLGIDCYNPAARQASAAQGKSLAENARVLALLAMAIHDALVSSMEAKYHYNFWRPVTAIRAGDTDGNPKTESDPGFLPLVTTPPFPSYPSNHASIGGAARAVLEHAFGESGHSISLSSPKIPGIVLTYTAWEQITDDVDDARIFGGIHFRFDQEAGGKQGRRVAEYIIRNELRPLRADLARFRDGSE